MKNSVAVPLDRVGYQDTPERLIIASDEDDDDGPVEALLARALAGADPRGSSRAMMSTVYDACSQQAAHRSARTLSMRPPLRDTGSDAHARARIERNVSTSREAPSGSRTR